MFVVGGKKKTTYYMVNAVCICAASVFFVKNYKDAGELFAEKTAASVLLLATALVVHCIKAGRLYFALYGNDIGLKKHLKVYCKVTAVSNVIPFKTGEFFRMYCYGKETGSFLKGSVIVLLDRFMDTVALVVVFTGTCTIFNGKQISIFAAVLMVFLTVVAVVYLVFPGFYRYWKKYFLRAEASVHKLMVLRTLENLQAVYRETEQVVKGRGVIMFGLSVLAWTVEIGSLVLAERVYLYNDRYTAVEKYLTAAMAGGESEGLRRFIFISVLLLVITYLITALSYKPDKKGTMYNEDICRI